MSKDYYETLGVSKDAGKDDIKKAYKKLAKKYHPDINKESGSEDKFKEINEAFSVLSDDQKRAQYDQVGSDGMKYGNDFGGFGYSDFSGGAGFDFSDLGDIFDTFFGGGGDDFFGFGGRGRRRGPSRGHDLRVNIELNLEEVASGVEKTIVVPKLETCSRCGGSGAKDPSAVHTCETCKGTGAVKRSKRTPFGMFQTTSPCSECHGSGKRIREYCELCDGDGRTQTNKKVKVKVPPGIEEGMQLKVSGEGEAGNQGAPAGDLFVLVRIRPHETFKRDGPNLHSEQDASFGVAALGGDVEVPTLTSTTKIKVPAGTQPGTVMRVRKEGLPELDGHGHGDLYVKVNVEVPTKLSRKQKELIKEFDEVAQNKKTGFF